MQELIEKLRAATAPSNQLDAFATVALFGGEFFSISGDSLLWLWRRAPGEAPRFPFKMTQLIDDLNEVFEKVLPGHGRIIAKGRVTETEPLYGCQIFSTDLSAAPIEPIGEGEHNLEAYAYLIAMLQAVEAKRGAAA